jgi:quercetin dioxygenase-like cupin family protein
MLGKGFPDGLHAGRTYFNMMGGPADGPTGRARQLDGRPRDARAMARYPNVISRLPEADANFPGVKVWLLQGPTGSAIFVEARADAVVPEHSHGAQWGIVVDGEMELSIGGVVRTYRPGDEYTIPAGTKHGARLRAGTRVIDVFDVPDRYRPRP